MQGEHEGDMEYARLQTELLDAADKLEALRALRASRGYRLICEHLQGLVDALSQQVLGKACASIDACLEQEWKKGNLQGLLQFELTVEGQFQRYSDERDSLRAQVENYDGENHG